MKRFSLIVGLVVLVIVVLSVDAQLVNAPYDQVETHTSRMLRYEAYPRIQGLRQFLQRIVDWFKKLFVRGEKTKNTPSRASTEVKEASEGHDLKKETKVSNEETFISDPMAPPRKKIKLMKGVLKKEASTKH